MARADSKPISPSLRVASTGVVWVLGLNGVGDHVSEGHRATARIGWRTAMAAVREHGQPRIDDPDRLAGVEAVGVDETAFQAAAATRSTSFATGVVDLTRGRAPARLLDIVEGRSASALLGWVDERDAAWRLGITTAALWRPEFLMASVGPLCVEAARPFSLDHSRCRISSSAA